MGDCPEFRRMPRVAFAISVIIVIGAAASDVPATVTVFTNKSAWQNAVGSHTTIDFVGYQHGMNIGDTYASIGVRFTDGQDWFWNLPETGFPNDFWGFDGGLNDASTIVFDKLKGSIAVDFPGAVKFTLLSQNQVIYESPLFIPAGIGNCRGLISDVAFDSVIIADPTGVLAVDDLHFGPPIPAPPAGALLLVGFGAFFRQRRRRGPEISPSAPS
jgi:hypothetical protein